MASSRADSLTWIQQQVYRRFSLAFFVSFGTWEITARFARVLEREINTQILKSIPVSTYYDLVHWIVMFVIFVLMPARLVSILSEELPSLPPSLLRLVSTSQTVWKYFWTLFRMALEASVILAIVYLSWKGILTDSHVALAVLALALIAVSFLWNFFTNPWPGLGETFTTFLLLLFIFLFIGAIGWVLVFMVPWLPSSVAVFYEEVVRGREWLPFVILIGAHLYVWRLADGGAPNPVSNFWQYVALIVATITLAFILQAKPIDELVPEAEIDRACVQEAAQTPPEDCKNLKLSAVKASSSRYEGLKLIFAALAAFFTLGASTGVVEGWLRRIVEILGLSPLQLRVARRLRLPARGAIKPDEILDARYRTEISINRSSIPRRAPFDVRSATSPARVKIIVNDSDDATRGERLTFQRILEIVESDRIDVKRSLFFVCFVAANGTTQIVAYGTFAEFTDLSHNEAEFAQSSRQIREAFEDALNSGEREEVRRIVEFVRASILKSNPDRDLMLSTATFEASNLLQDAMDTMAKAGLRRILLVSPRQPFEYGLLSSAEISRFLLGY